MLSSNAVVALGMRKPVSQWKLVTKTIEGLLGYIWSGVNPRTDGPVEEATGS